MQAIFYRDPTLLNRNQHADLKLVPRNQNDFAFAARTNSVLLAAVEFASAAAHYPIAFSRQADGRIAPVAVLGLRDSENVFIDENGAWLSGCYVPAFVRRYPFVLAEASSSELQVCFDATYHGFSQTEGEPLFESSGEPAALLQQALQLLQDYHTEFIRTDDFCRALQELDLFKDAALDLQITDGERYVLQGLLVVDDAKLAALSVNVLGGLAKSGYLAFIHAHLISQGSLSRLCERFVATLEGSAASHADDEFVGPKQPQLLN